MLVTLIVLEALLLFVFVFCLVLYFTTFYSPHKGQNDVAKCLLDDDYSEQQQAALRQFVTGFSLIPFEKISVKSFDGLHLFGRLYAVENNTAVAICFHGYRGTAVRDCSAFAALLMENGFNVILTEHRAHSHSQGHTITFGEKERFDCVSWVNYAVERFGKDVKIVLFGVSMGATTVLCASQWNLQNVCGIVADCPYSSPKGILCKVCGDMKISTRLAYPFLWLSARVFGHFDPSNVSAVDAVKSCKVPVLIMHGETDGRVPCEMSRQIAAANSVVQLHTFPDAPHGLSILSDNSRYTQIFSQFVQGVLQTQSA